MPRTSYALKIRDRSPTTRPILAESPHAAVRSNGPDGRIVRRAAAGPARRYCYRVDASVRIDPRGRRSPPRSQAFHSQALHIVKEAGEPARVIVTWMVRSDPHD